MDFYKILLNEIIYKIGNYLTLYELISLYSCCNSFNELFYDLIKQKIIKIPIRLTIINDKRN